MTEENTKVSVSARSYSLSGDSGKITFHWKSDRPLKQINRIALVEKIERLISLEIEKHNSES